jgi:hypothetical protein
MMMMNFFLTHFCVLASFFVMASAFLAPQQQQRPRAFLVKMAVLPGDLEPMPGESSHAHMRRILALASNRQAWERAVRGAKSESQTETTATTAAHDNNTNTFTTKAVTPTTTTNSATSKKKGYQRVEDWEHDQQELARAMTLEQRMQFDGLRHGNAVRQDGILRNALKKF